jgi:tetratricopeptide (TPR) repeat protein
MMTKHLRAFAVAGGLVAALSLGAMAASSDGSSGDDKASAASGRGDEVNQLYAKGMELVRAGDYEAALKQFKQATRERRNDPEILNMTAYCLRKTGKLDDAFDFYRKALRLKPRFPQAREYLGEAHIQAVLTQIEELRGYGPDGEKELAELVTALKQAAAGVDTPEGMPQEKAKGW